MTKDQLWAALILAGGVFEGWLVYRSIESGKWMVWSSSNLSVERRANPVSFWAIVGWHVCAMIVLLFLGTYMLTPLILSIVAK